MQARILRISLPFLVFVLAAPGIFAQAPPRRGGMGAPRYDKTTEATVHGTVEAVLTVTPGTGGGRGMAMGGTHLTFTVEDGKYDVHLGPAAWLAEKKFEFTKGDQLTIVGLVLTINGEKALIAREITKGGTVMTLRDANGIPAWSGRGRRTQS